jgi:hypothetical protein
MESHEEWVTRQLDLIDASNAKPSIATKYAHNQWSVVTIVSMRSAILWMKNFGQGSYLLRKAPRGEYTVTTKELKAMLRKERR